MVIYKDYSTELKECKITNPYKFLAVISIFPMRLGKYQPDDFIGEEKFYLSFDIVVFFVALKDTIKKAIFLRGKDDHLFKIGEAWHVSYEHGHEGNRRFPKNPRRPAILIRRISRFPEGDSTSKRTERKRARIVRKLALY
jgi:hypothetical protein